MRRLWRAQTDEERHQLLDVSYAARGREKPADAVVRGKRGDWAQWWLLEVDGRNVSCLLCYPLEFGDADGNPVPGFGLGAVSTLPEAKRRGHAQWLCGEMGRRMAHEGREIGLLYSAIPPAYYERLGYRVCAAWDFATTDLEGLADAAPPAAMTEVDPRDERPRLVEAYAAYHRGRLHLRRDAALHERTLAINPDDTWHVFDGGYVRVACDERELEVVELICDPSTAPAVLAACAAMAQERGLPQVCGWLDPTPFVEARFESRSRAKTLPMTLGIRPGPTRFWGSDYF